MNFVLGDMKPWHSESYGFLFEHQWQLSSQFTNFIGARVDKDSYTEYFWSPRWALIWTPDQDTAFKAIWSKSLRKNFGEELRTQHLGNELSKPEELRSWELIAEQQYNDHFKYSVSLFYNYLDVLGIDSKTLRSEPIASMQFGGVELVADYHTDHWQWQLSHSYTKLDSFAAFGSQKISASPSGYGNDISDWPVHITKLSAHWQPNVQWSYGASLRIFWGFPGQQDFAQLTVDKRQASADGNSSSTALTDPSYTDPFEESLYLNLSTRYQFDDNNSIALHGHNLLGLIDGRYNKRNYLINVGNYREEATALSVSYSLSY